MDMQKELMKKSCGKFEKILNEIRKQLKMPGPSCTLKRDTMILMATIVSMILTDMYKELKMKGGN